MTKHKSLKTLLATLTFCVGLSSPVFAADYKVSSGDSLYKIGQLFNVSSDSIIKNNNLKGNTIHSGQVLNIPCNTYTVKSRDSLFLISKARGISLYNLRKANNKWDDTIYPGQVLNLPGKTSSNTSPAPAPTTPKPIANYTESDLDLLARLITAEAQSEPYSAQVAVASVVINRIKSSQFPDSISSVIYQKSDGYYQFTPVLNGWINKPATETSKKAAKEALYGSDPSKGALYYFDDTATNKWLWSKPITARIGNMVYVK
ncbi:peptidoglycan-binding protein [Clostridium sporogenes]|uniref:Peptidoglycan-binding protein n=2 Tax=Clostridium TaxID=1485 RepID=A0AAE4Z2W7_CLOSG|nr:MULTISPECIES: cell wall hydrolase [Clostridium]MBE6076507.1 LysM peptidoglycan-binding domain-containing protein [Clostridium lundense]MDU2833385.1 cell wall hydrolase [Clostridium botulinum]EDU37470.1 LysM domain protein [Clostridium sporogenes ATCC 15579]KIS23326.1 peptidoglycan-binding protein [Clostridium botulinum B2 450]MCW6093562.1 cell wall hydrolase [Clostridium sporogenes]